MMQESYPHFLISYDKKKIHYSTNFNPHTLLKDDVVLVFNYGLVCNNHHWLKQIPYFDKMGKKILIHDYRCHLPSEGAEDLQSCRFQNFVSDLRDILKQLKISSCIMIGHSMGVNITLEFAKIYPEFLKGMVLISGTVIPPHGTIFESNYMEFIVPFSEKLFSYFPYPFKKIWKLIPKINIIKWLIREGGFNPDQVPLDFVKNYLETISRLPPALFFKLFHAMGDHDIIAHLEKIQTPALIISGDQDKIIPNHYQDILHKKLPNSLFYMVKDGSHVPQVDFPDLVNERIEMFIRTYMN